MDSSTAVRVDGPSVGVSASRMLRVPADSVTCQFQSQLTLATLDHELDLITRSEYSPSFTC